MTDKTDTTTSRADLAAANERIADLLEGLEAANARNAEIHAEWTNRCADLERLRQDERGLLASTGELLASNRQLAEACRHYERALSDMTTASLAVLAARDCAAKGGIKEATDGE